MPWHKSGDQPSGDVLSAPYTALFVVCDPVLPAPRM